MYFCDGIVEMEFALLPKLHQRRAGDGFGHREYLHDGIASHGALGFTIGITERAEIGFFAVLRHKGGDADEGAFVDEAFEGFGDFRGVDLAGGGLGAGGLREAQPARRARVASINAQRSAPPDGCLAAEGKENSFSFENVIVIAD